MHDRRIPTPRSVTRRRILLGLGATGAALGLEACGGGGGGGSPAPTPAPTPAPSPPVSTGAPAISGLPRVGRALSVGTGSWSNTPTSYTYQWKKADPLTGAVTAIPGATGASYTPVEADKYFALSCDVTALNSAGSATATSPATIGLLPAMPVGATISAQGDSVLAGANANTAGTAPDAAFAWVRLFADAMGASVTNQAVGGYSLVETGSGNSVVAAVAGGNAVGASKRDFVVISAGGNDALSPAISVDLFASSYRQLLNGLSVAGYGRDAILIGAFYSVTDAILSASGADRARWEAFRAAERQVAAEYGVTWLDFYQGTPGAGDLSSDNFHPSRQGHRKLADLAIASQPSTLAAPKTPNPRAAPGGLTAAAAGAGALSASCTALAGATGYVFAVIRATDFVLQASPVSTTPSRSISGLAAGTYFVAVKATLDGGVETPWRINPTPLAVA